jgi:hypothetical protein
MKSKGLKVTIRQLQDNSYNPALTTWGIEVKKGVNIGEVAT